MWGAGRRRPSASPGEGLRGTRACQHPVLGPPASRTRRKETSAKFPDLRCSLWQTTTDPYLTPHTSRYGLSFQKKTIQLLGADVREHAGLRLRKDFSHKTKQEN